MSAKKTKNDKAWEKIFQEDEILEKIKTRGLYRISSERINQERESRLMTKFDHKAQLPEIFVSENLSIQPVTRGEYIIGNFESYFSFPKISRKRNISYIPLDYSLESINTEKISSESTVILCAYLTGMIDIVIGEKSHFTSFGRMSSGEFEYFIDNSQTYPTSIHVKNTQCEIDGGFESENKFAIIEAKCQSVDDFIVRQLYYPFRLWSNKISKPVIPIFLTFSNNIFSFYIFKFKDLNHYNSLNIIQEFHFCIGSHEIYLSDIRHLLKQKTKCKLNINQPFPQADKFPRIVDLLEKLYQKSEPLTKSFLTDEYGFDKRQTDYYGNAASYLGLVEKVKKENESGYHLTNFGQKILDLDPKQRNLELARCILSHNAFKLTLLIYLEEIKTPTKREIVEILRNSLQNQHNYAPSVLKRRSTTVLSWVEWILSLTTGDDY